MTLTRSENPVNRVLVTGATGFIGCHTIRPLIDRGFEVHVVSGQSNPRWPDTVPKEQRHSADLLDPAKVEALIASVQPSHLLHLAWFVKPGELIGSTMNLDWTVASLGILRTFKKHGGRRFIGVGSCYENDWEFGYCSERLTPVRPNTLYGASKNAFRECAEAYCAISELQFAWARIFFLYGPNENEKRLVPSIILSLLNGDEAKSSHGLQVRDYMHVQDAANGIANLVESHETGCFNIASGRAHQIRDIVITIGEELGACDLLKIGAIPARPNDAPMVVADIGKAISKLGFAPEFGLDDGIRHTIEWWNSSRR